MGTFRNFKNSKQAQKATSPKDYHDGKNIGWGVREYPDPTMKSGMNQIPKPMVRGFDRKNTHQFVYQQEGFSAALDKKLGFQYSDKFSIRAMREEI